MNIVEAYSKKLNISEKVYAKEHGGRQLSDMKKAAIARVLANTAEYLTEAFSNSTGTQFNNMGTFKKFCLDLTTVALPNLIANELVIVSPMKSRTGGIQYFRFTAGTNKGGVKQNDLFNDVFKLGEMTDDRINYTGAAVTEAFDAHATTPVNVALAWDKAVKGAFTVITVGGVTKEFNPLETYTPAELATKTTKDLRLTDVTTAGSETVAYVDLTSDGKVPAASQEAAHKYKVAYFYDNVVIPQNDIPQLTAHMEFISLEAKARRIGIYYSQMAAFQAKTEMGIDLGEVLASQACGELSYEIDTEVVKLLVDNANDKWITEEHDLEFNKRQPIGVSIRDHYAAFANTLEVGSQKIYDATQKHAANYMVCASNVKPVLVMMDGWKAASTAKINGPYYAGEINGIKVYVSPAMKPGEFILGFNGDDMYTSAAVYAPYMAIVPTQLLGYSDGSMSQGFSTLYDLKMLNPALLVKGAVVDKDFFSGNVQNKVLA